MTTDHGSVSVSTNRSPKITARKWQGNDAYSWAVFIDDIPFVTGLSRREVPYYKVQAANIIREREQRK